ncbi:MULTISPECIES: hypothetical protein, partial [unclassified Mesorhizobium]|uniref:hypothetical protein n=1 Tax=unclassified Mesorhizobium TaxID=325217 RepID=UPI0019D19025
MRRKAAIHSAKEMGEWPDRLLESISANCLVTYWCITIMLVAEGRRFRQEINMLAGGSPTLFPRILSYGLANRKTMDENSYWLR